MNPYLDHQSVPRLLPFHNTVTKERNIRLFSQARFEIDRTEDSDLLRCYAEVNIYRRVEESECLHLQGHFLNCLTLTALRNVAIYQSTRRNIPERRCGKLQISKDSVLQAALDRTDTAVRIHLPIKLPVTGLEDELISRESVYTRPQLSPGLLTPPSLLSKSGSFHINKAVEA